jgi:hypothetical protein
LEHLSLHFDGLLVDSGFAGSAAVVKEAIEQGVAEITGFILEFALKEHSTLHALAFRDSVECGEWSGNENVLSADGNCIPASKAFITGDTQAICSLTQEDVRMRRYKDWCSDGFHLQAEQEVPSEAGDYLVHLPNGASPHCICLHIQQDGCVRLIGAIARLQVTLSMKIN